MLATRRIGALRVVEGTWAGKRLLTEPQRVSLADVTIQEFDSSVTLKQQTTEFTREQRKEIIKRVKESQVVQDFGLSFIIMAIIGWIITKILDYLWDNWKQEQSLYGHPK